jgi:hypothetical protein
MDYIDKECERFALSVVQKPDRQAYTERDANL